MKKENTAVVFCHAGLDLPVLNVVAETLPEAWETAVLQTWKNGATIKTQYDKEGDPPSKDVTLCMTIKNPFAEPRIHLAFPGGITDLEIYRQEVVDGIHDHWVDPEHGKWEYTYHERLFEYSVPIVGPMRLVDGTPKTKVTHIPPHKKIDQIQYIIDTLAEAPHSRRAQAITWKPWEDCGIHDPACLQSVWCRIFDDKLVMNARMRSNDAFKAAFMNIYAFTDLQRIIAEGVSEKLGRKIKVGQYTHIADSFHVYGSYFNEFEGFLKQIEVRTFEQRTWDSTSDLVQELIAEARDKIKNSIEAEKKTGQKGIVYNG